MTKSSDQLSYNLKDYLDERFISIGQRMDRIEKSIDGLSSTFVTKQEFDPIKRVVYGVISVIIFAVFTALVALVVVKK